MKQPVDAGPAIGVGGVQALPPLVRVGAKAAAEAAIEFRVADHRPTARQTPERPGRRVIGIVQIDMHFGRADGQVIGGEDECEFGRLEPRGDDAPPRDAGRPWPAVWRRCGIGHGLAVLDRAGVLPDVEWEGKAPGVRRRKPHHAPAFVITKFRCWPAFARMGMLFL